MCSLLRYLKLATSYLFLAGASETLVDEEGPGYAVPGE